MTASNTKLPVVITGEEFFDRFMMDAMLDADSLITKMLNGAGEEATVLIVAMLEQAFNAGRLCGQEDMCETDPRFAVFRAPTAH